MSKKNFPLKKNIQLYTLHNDDDDKIKNKKETYTSKC